MKNLLYFIFIIAFLFSSCVSKKKITYFQYDEVDQENVTNKYTTIFKPDDLLSIAISAQDIEAAKPFNLIQVAAAVEQPLYLIDSKGDIDFPVLGKLKIGGLTREQTIQLLKNKLDPDYLKNPSVNIRIANFKVTVLGDVGGPGSYTVPNERITILEAIALAGDANITAQRDNVLVTREENGVKNFYRLDLRSNNLFTSPVYYLQQNDIIYVEPNYASTQRAAQNPSISLILSLVSFAALLINILTR